MTTNYIPVDSILYDLSLTIDERYWNEARALEWANKAARLIRSDQMMESKLAVLQVTSHKTELPSDLKYLVQIVYKTSSCQEDTCFPELNLPANSDLQSKLDGIDMLQWAPMRLTTSPYHQSLCLNESLLNCQVCSHEFSVSSELILTTTLQSGVIMVAYIGVPMKDDKLLIPDNEEVKEAIMSYVLYRYWMSKYNMMEDGSEQRMKHYLTMWNTLSKKAAGNLNLPDVNELENLMSQFNRLVPRENRFQQMFLTLNNRESLKF